MSQEKIQTPAVEETKGTEVAPTTETGTDATVKNESSEQADTQEIDYKKKFSESTRENQRILEEQKAKDAEIERLRLIAEAKQENAGATYGSDSEPLYPGFETLSQDEQKNLIAYSEGIKKKALQDIYKDPSIAFARETYNEKKWDSAFQNVVERFPELKDSRDDFKSKYFKKSNIPDNIEDILVDLSKVYLFDKARDIGAKDAVEREKNRIDVERQQAGDKSEPKATTRTLEEWYRLAQTDPAKFANLSAEYNKDVKSGKLK